MSTNNNSSGNSNTWIMPTVPGGWYTITVGGGGGQVAPPVEAVAAKKVNKDGCFCKKCKEHFPYAEPNQEDGTLICYCCRNRW